MGGKEGPVPAQGPHPRKVGPGGLQVVEGFLPGVPGLLRKPKPPPHLLHGAKEAPQGGGLSLQLPAYRLAVEHCRFVIGKVPEEAEEPKAVLGSKESG